MGLIAPETRTVTGTQQALLRTLVYFDVFNHPLRRDELVRFLGTSCSGQEPFGAALAGLLRDGLLVEHDGYFGLGRTSEAVQARMAGEERARDRMHKAHRMSRLIGRFPFVRGVMLSGSISKGVLAEDGDIDYFVITAPGRLWVARTLLIAFKKVFLLNRRRDFCVNYFLDTDHLPVEDRNLFTATEVVTLVPMHGRTACSSFFEANRWALGHLPNAGTPLLDRIPDGTHPLQRLWEHALSGWWGDELDAWCMMRTRDRWHRKFPEMDALRFELALRSRRYVSKHHPRNFQEKVLAAFARGMDALEARTGIAIS